MGKEESKYRFGYEFQQEILYCCLRVGGFLDRVRGALSPSLFTDVLHQVIAEAILEHYDSQGTKPSKGATLDSLRTKVKDKGGHYSFAACRREFDKLWKLTDIDHNFVGSEVKTFAAEMKVREVVADIDYYLESGNFEELTQDITSAASYRLPEPTLVSYGDGAEARFKSYKTGYKKAGIVPTGIAQLDLWTCGGPGAGELAVLLGLPNSGKSQFMVHFGAVAALSGKRVQHFSLEMTRQELFRRYDRRITMLPETAMSKKARTLARKVANLQLHLAAYEAGCLRPSELRNAVVRNGIPDLLIVDYPAKMWAGDDPKFTRFNIASNYLACRKLAQEFGFAVWAPFQANRAGHETQKSEGSWLSMENVAEAYEVNRDCDLHVSWNQTPEEGDDMEGRLVIIKNRSGPKDKIIKVSVDWGQGLDSKSFVTEI